MAAERIGRRAYAMDIEPRYVDVAVRRWQAFTGKDAVDAESGWTFEQLTERAGSTSLEGLDQQLQTEWEFAMARKSKIQSHGSDNNPDMRSDAFPSGLPAEEEYKVGPGRPPKEHQFKPGQSGNPKGAKRKAPSLIPDLKELFERAFNQTAKVTQGERARFVTMWAAGLQSAAWNGAYASA
jgi:hypothetical protein